MDKETVILLHNATLLSNLKKKVIDTQTKIESQITQKEIRPKKIRFTSVWKMQTDQ